MSKPSDSPHYEFSVRAHLIRWFHERETNELKAMKDAFDAHRASLPITSPIKKTKK